LGVPKQEEIVLSGSLVCIEAYKWKLENIGTKTEDN